MKKELQTVRMGVFGGEIFSPPFHLLYLKPQRTQRAQRTKKFSHEGIYNAVKSTKGHEEKKV